VRPKTEMHVMDRTFTPTRIKPQIIGHTKPLPCNYNERSIVVSTRNTDGTSAVDFFYGGYN